MLISKKVSVVWNANNVRRYKRFGYNYTKIGDSILISVEDLPLYSKALVKVRCDYCKIKYDIKYDHHLRGVKFIKKDSCTDIACRVKKQKEVFFKKYKVDSSFKVKRFRNKGIRTLLKKYGVDNVSKNEEIKNQKSKTTFKNYGVDNPFKSKKIIKDIRNKRAKAMYENGTHISSKQQRHIHEILKGELNYPIGKINVDIAFPRQKTYIEYDGSGHDICCAFNNIDKKSFDRRELKRIYYLKNRGWKMMRIISKQDRLPQNYMIRRMFSIAKNILKNKSWVKFHIDSSLIETSHSKTKFNFDKLIKLPRQNQ